MRLPAGWHKIGKWGLALDPNDYSSLRNVKIVDTYLYIHSEKNEPGHLRKVTHVLLKTEIKFIKNIYLMGS